MLKALPGGKSIAAHMMLQKVVKNIPSKNLKMRYKSGKQEQRKGIEKNKIPAALIKS